MTVRYKVTAGRIGPAVLLIIPKEAIFLEQVISSISNSFNNMEMEGTLGSIFHFIVYFSRFALPVAAIAILARCARSMLRERYEPEVWAYLDLPNGARVPLRNWECTVGSSPSCDVVVDDPEVSKTQLVLIRDRWGNWTVHDITGNTQTCVDDTPVPTDGISISDGDELILGQQSLLFYNLTEEEREIIARQRTAPGRSVTGAAMFRYISAFQLLILFQQIYFCNPEHRTSIFLAFSALFVVMWLYFVIMRAIGRRGFEVEAIAFFLSSVGLSVCATSTPDNMLKQIILTIVGIAIFIVLGFWLRDLDRVKKMRFPAAAVAVVLLAVNFIFGTEQFGAKNWLSIGGFSLQPSEFVKIVFIYAGAATMDRLYMKRNLLAYIGFSAICVGALALMGDFGTALIFFMTFLVISFMRSGNIGTVLLAITGAALAGVLALTVKPHIAQRFAAWGHVWEDIYDTGYQQTHAMSAAASGGFFGMGSGNGWLKNLVAADTDLVFCLVSEELGLIVALCMVVALILLALFVVRNGAQGRSSFYVIAGSAAVSMLLIQMSLNVFGSLDILPFTGVTFPFVSLGGSSLISCWALLAFIKATDTRKNASFVVKPPNKMRDMNEFSGVNDWVLEEPQDIEETDKPEESEAPENFEELEQLEDSEQFFVKDGEKMESVQTPQDETDIDSDQRGNFYEED